MFKDNLKYLSQFLRETKEFDLAEEPKVINFNLIILRIF